MATDLKKVFSKRLAELQPNVTGADKLEAQTTLKLSRPTLDKYLSGTIAKLDVAEKIYVFFLAKVNQRKDILEAA